MSEIENVMRSLTFEFFGGGKHKIKPNEFLAKDNALFLDVRSKEEANTLSFELLQHKIPVLNIPINEVPDRLEEIPKDRFIGVFCSSSVRSSIVYIYLRSKGYDNVLILEGGYNSIAEEFKPGKLLKTIKSKKQ
ncbi:MAG TPA: rhodanese-like domain-containing protein [Candidatus Bathyarchaeota archaeon]|nr:rhodanese-like domain-containing protein [Candidatus Bathyarchaeota archaeon]